MRILKAFLLLVFSVPLCAQVNPHTQIRWPLNCGTGTGRVYNFQTNACVDINSIDPSSQIVWPPSCIAGTLYNPSSNTCVTAGAGNNPGGTNTQIQFNNGGFFGG